jgi:GNAT superfamily N-acetyltransferase
MVELLSAVHRWLPVRFFAHFSPGIERYFEHTHRLASHGKHFKMMLRDRSQLVVPESSSISALSPGDVDEVHAFYDESFPETWFDPRMLESGQYYGWREGEKLVSVGGIHVYSPQYRVAALGNITTHPEYRGRGFAAAVTARVCGSVCEEADHVGLNVKADNFPALACYRRLGFEVAVEFGEFMVELK